MKKDLTKAMDAAESILGALTDAFACLDYDNDIEGCCADLLTIQEGLRQLLPECGIYAYIHDDTDPGDIEPVMPMAFSSIEEAEKSLNEDINVTLENLDNTGCITSYDAEICGHDLVLHTDNYHVVYWKRMYDPDTSEIPDEHECLMAIKTYSEDLEAYCPVIPCIVPDKDFDLLKAAREAAQEYVESLEGRHYFNGAFNWINFIEEIPNSFHEKHGYKLVDVFYTSDDGVNVDECLVEDPGFISFGQILAELPHDKNEALRCGIIGERNGYWTDGNVIFCETEEDADYLQDWLSEWCEECEDYGENPAKALGEPYKEGGRLCPWTVYLIDYDVPTDK